MIKVTNLSKYYSDKAAIKDISFHIERGEIIGLLGLNGAGKSTVLKILGCYLAPSGGSAEITGFEVSKDQEQIRKIIGYLPDTPPLYDEMTVTGYLRFVARLKGVKRNLSRYVNEAMERTNIIDVANTPLGQLSHGYRQRAGIAQAIVHKPQVIILDEPINGLDPIQIVEMRDLIKSLKGDHTVILSSHILSEITKTCDRMLIVDRGRLVAEGSEKQLSKTMSEQMTIVCLMDRASEGLINDLKKLQGVFAVQRRSESEGSSVVAISTEKDVRRDIAKLVVSAEAGLLQMQREEGGLENLFMNLIRDGAAPIDK